MSTSRIANHFSPQPSILVVLSVCCHPHARAAQPGALSWHRFYYWIKLLLITVGTTELLLFTVGTTELLCGFARLGVGSSVVVVRHLVLRPQSLQFRLQFAA